MSSTQSAKDVIFPTYLDLVCLLVVVVSWTSSFSSFSFCFLAADLVRGGENTNEGEDFFACVSSSTKLATGGGGGEIVVGDEKPNCVSSSDATGSGTTIVAEGMFVTLLTLTVVVVVGVTWVTGVGVAVT